MNYDIIIAWVYHLMADSIISFSMPGGSAVPGLRPVSYGNVYQTSKKLNSDWDILCITYCYSTVEVGSSSIWVCGIGPIYVARSMSGQQKLYLPTVGDVSTSYSDYTPLIVYAGYLTTSLELFPSDPNNTWFSYILYKLDT